jgi:tRNA threonylcarbamoyladenosine modification (KEOPS) complex  Pcc1 subunit
MPRSEITLEDRNGQASFIVTAQDVTALRASVTSITSVLGVYHKTKEVVHG